MSGHCSSQNKYIYMLIMMFGIYILKYVLPLCIKTMLYNTLILPHITYGIMVWGYQRNRLNKIQNKAIRIITSNKYNSHTEPLFKQLNMLKLEYLLKLQQLKFYLKFNEGSLPVYLQNWDITPNARVHNYNTRELGFCKKMPQI